jgi:RHS repeat-associated protein
LFHKFKPALLQGEYSYGASNQRLWSKDYGLTTVETYYAWEGGMTLAEYSPSGADALTWQKSFIYLGGRLLATESGAGTYQYHHPDRLGTRLITNSSGGIISEQIHLPYGTALSGESTNYGSPDNPSKKRFTSYERSDGTKLDHAVNRQYHSGLGRFTQVDPIGMGASSLSDPQSLNLYAYCGNDPINYIDPDGLFFKKLFRAFGKILRILKIAVLVAATVLALITLNIPALIRLGVEWLYEFGPGWLRKAIDIGLGFVSRMGGNSDFRTPPTFGNGSSNGVNGFLAKQIRSRKIPVGGAFSFSDWRTLLLVRFLVTSALKRPECAALLSGLKKANLLNRRAKIFNAETVNPAYNGIEKRMADTARQRGFAAISEAPGRKTALTDLFFRPANGRAISLSAQATILIHEMKHHNGFPPERDGYDYRADYDEISQKCGTQSPYRQ